jgi:hypothetical protein
MTRMKKEKIRLAILLIKVTENEIFFISLSCHNWT